MAMEDDIRVLVYLVTGFLEAGKTEFMNGTMRQPYFQEDGRTLLILCENGEIKYDEEFLKKALHTDVEKVKSQEELSPEYLEKLEKTYHPARVIVEYNGMWRVSLFESTPLPDGWGIIQKITIVNADTFSTYIANMKPLFVEMVRDADLVVFNRCRDTKLLAGYRRSVKVVSAKTEVVFENNGEQIMNIFENDVPYDIKAPVIKIENEDFGIWYVDAMDRPDRYRGKQVELTACAIRPKEYPEDAFYVGRRAMTCCAADISFIGYPCRYNGGGQIRSKEWVKVRARVAYAYDKKSKEDRPLLHAIAVEKTDPVSELVYFN